MSDHIETLRSLQRWIKAVGTEEADSYQPPSERAADAAIDNVLRENQHLRDERQHVIAALGALAHPACSLEKNIVEVVLLIRRLTDEKADLVAENKRLWTAVEQAREERDHEAERG